MALETGTYISDLVSTNPVGTDTLDKADDHLRLIKSTLQATFPNITGAVTPTHTDLNKLTSTGNPQFATIELGAATDTTISRVSAGLIAVEGGNVPLENRANNFTQPQQIASIELGNASDTTISRVSAGVIAVEGGTVALENRTNVFTATQDIGNGTGSPYLRLNGASGSSKNLSFRTNGSTRWIVYSSSAAESGSNAGSDFFIAAYDDTETFLYSPLKITRSTGDITVPKNLLVNGTGGIGYGTGSGGTVTQLTNKSTGVTLNKTNGQITMNAAALAANAYVAFTFTNSTIEATDNVIVNYASGGAMSSYWVRVAAISAGACTVGVQNVSGGSLSQAIVLTFTVIKGVTA